MFTLIFTLTLTITLTITLTFFTENINKMFSTKSSPEEWDARGDEFFNRNLFNVAAKCFLKSGNERKQKLAEAHQKAIDATHLKANPKE